MKTKLTFDNNVINFSMECTKEFNKSQNFTLKNNGMSVILRAIRIKENGEDNVHITCWLGKYEDNGDSEKEIEPHKVIFNHVVDYIRNQRYYFTYYCSDENPLIECINVGLCPHKKVDGGISNDSYKESENIYRHNAYMSPKFARKELRYLRRNGLISKSYWDKLLHWGDIDCLACHIPGQSYMPLSTPASGRVIESGAWTNTKTKFLDYKFSCNHNYNFVYRGYGYRKIPSKDWLMKTYYDEEEWNSYRSQFKPKNNTWQNVTEYNETQEKLSHIQYKPNKTESFEDVWEKCGSYWRSPDGKVSNFNGKNPVIGAYERVYSPQMIQYTERYPDFKYMWESAKEDTKVEYLYRRIADGKLLKESDGSKVEKVFTLGYYSTPYPGSVECPVCKELYEISKSINIYGFWKTKVVYPIMFKIAKKVICSDALRNLSIKYPNNSILGWKNGSRW